MSHQTESNNYVQQLPGFHCMRCHKNRGTIEDGCTGNGTACTNACDEKLKNISNPSSWERGHQTELRERLKGFIATHGTFQGGISSNMMGDLEDLVATLIAEERTKAYGEGYKQGKFDVAADFENKAKEEYKRGRKNGFEEARKVTHDTEDGWCCACDYDIGELENRIKEERTRVVEILKGMKKNLVTFNDSVPMNCNPRCHDSGKETALSEALLAITVQDNGIPSL